MTEEEFYKNISESVKSFRKKNKLSQKEMKNVLQTTSASLSLKEKGKIKFSLYDIFLICQKYEILPEYFMGYNTINYSEEIKTELNNIKKLLITKLGK